MLAGEFEPSKIGKFRIQDVPPIGRSLPRGRWGRVAKVTPSLAAHFEPPGGKEMLQIERAPYDRHRNLVVAATGTGKTVIAALDYRQLSEDVGRNLSLLFVAHRETILQQALATFRHVMRSGEFGEIHAGGKIASGEHVFGMVNSLNAQAIDHLEPGAGYVPDKGERPVAFTWRLATPMPEEIFEVARSVAAA